METRSKVLLSVITIYMQQQIAELADALQETYRAVRRIEQGQMDDRIGLLLAGRDQIRYSLNAAPEEKISAMASGRSNMLVAQKQLLQTFKSRVGGFEPLPEGKFARFSMEWNSCIQGHTGKRIRSSWLFRSIILCISRQHRWLLHPMLYAARWMLQSKYLLMRSRRCKE